jgi:hypothetical protein
MDITAIANFGVAGFAIYIMWRMYDANKKERENNDTHTRAEREKFNVKFEDQVKTHNIFQEKVRNELMTQLRKNSDAFERVLKQLK